MGATVSPPRQRSAYPKSKASADAPHHSQVERVVVALDSSFEDWAEVAAIISEMKLGEV